MYPGDVVGDVGGVYDAGTATGGGTVGGNWGGTVGGVIGSSGAVLEQATPATGSIGTVSGATKDITAGTAVLNKTSVLDSDTLLLKQR